MTDFSNTPEHYVGRAVFDLTSDLAVLVRMTEQPRLLDLLAFDRDTLTDAHKQLGRLIERVPTLHRTAAE